MKKGHLSEKTKSLIEDWNKGYRTSTLQKKYGYKSYESLINRIHTLRKKGYQLALRGVGLWTNDEDFAKDWNNGMSIDDLSEKYNIAHPTTKACAMIAKGRDLKRRPHGGYRHGTRRITKDEVSL